MRRILTTMFNGLLCYLSVIAFRLLLAIPHRWIIQCIAPGRLYYP